MIYDCFAFFNELELLEIRLNELDAVVDKFVIVEATRTFQKNPKALIFADNKHLFEKFLPKIIHIVVDEYPNFFSKFRNPTPRDYDNHQKEFILKGIIDANDEDIIIVSDIDEIPRPYQILAYKNINGVKVFEQNFYYYYLNMLCIKSPNGTPDLWRGPVMLRKKDINTIRKVRTLRGKEGPGITIVPNGGWHFSYMGGVENIITKIEALSHDEFNKKYYKDAARLKELIEKGMDIFDRNQSYTTVNIDDTFPLYLRERANSFAHLIKTV